MRGAILSRAKKKFKVGDVVEITYDDFIGETGEITKQSRVDAPDLWWVRLSDRVERFHESWLKKVKPKKPKPARKWLARYVNVFRDDVLKITCATRLDAEYAAKEINRLERKIAKLEKGVINGRA